MGVVASSTGGCEARLWAREFQAAKVAKHLGVSLHFLLFSEEDTEEPLHKLIKQDVFNGTFEINITRAKIGSPKG